MTLVTERSGEVIGETRQPKPADAFSILQRLEGNLIKIKQRGNKPEGITTGFPELDLWTDGMVRGHLWVIGGGSSVGKTAFATQLILNGLVTGKARVAYFLMETTAEDLILRMLGSLTRIPIIKIKRSILTDIETKKVEEAKTKLIDSGLMIFDDPVYRDIKEMEKTVKLHYDNKKPFDVVVYDHLDHARKGDKTSEYEQKTEIIYDFQTIAKEYKHCFIALSQITISNARGGRMDYLSFKGSGGILDASECAFSLTRSRIDNPSELVAELGKNRHGRQGVLKLHFDLPSQRITAFNIWNEIKPSEPVNIYEDTAKFNMPVSENKELLKIFDGGLGLDGE